MDEKNSKLLCVVTYRKGFVKYIFPKKIKILSKNFHITFKEKLLIMLDLVEFNKYEKVCIKISNLEETVAYQKYLLEEVTFNELKFESE